MVYHCTTCGKTTEAAPCCPPMATDAERWGRFVSLIAEALGVKEEWGGGFTEQHILDAIEKLKRTP